MPTQVGNLPSLPNLDKTSTHYYPPLRLERLARKCPNDVEYLNLCYELELWKQLFFNAHSYLEAKSGTENKEKAITNFSSWLKSQNPLDIMVYTDGSQEVHKNNVSIGATASWILNWVRNWLQKQGLSLRNSIEVYNTEVIAMLEGLKHALESPMARVATGIHICLDNLGVARNMGRISNSFSQQSFKLFRNLVKNWSQIERKLTV